MTEGSVFGRSLDATGGVLRQDPISVDVQTAAQNLTEDIGSNRAAIGILNEDVGIQHRSSHIIEWQIGSANRAKQGVQETLEQLADLGFAWRDLAKMIGVSVPALQKWRRGQKTSGENRLRAAAVLAACDLVAKHYLIEQVASWFEVPLVANVPVTPIVLYAENRPDLVFEFASAQKDPEELLTEFDVGWRLRYRSNFEVFEAEDGNLSLRSKE